MATPADAVTYYRDLVQLNRQVAGRTLRLWRRIDHHDISGSWTALIPEAAAILAAGQTVAAEMADPYLIQILGDTGGVRPVDPEAFAGVTPAGQPLESLIYLPVIDAKQSIGAGASPASALRQAQSLLTMYTRTTVADAGRLSVSAGMAARPHATGYYRALTPPSCSRCAILAGKHFAWNAGFDRHPRCDCVHIPVRYADDSLRFDAKQAIAAGKVTGLSHADTYSILQLGADPSQVVNAQRGMYTAGGRKFTTEGVTRRGIAGARILERDLQRALGNDVRGKTFRNWTFSRQRALEYSELLRQGKTYTRLTKTGRTQAYAYRYARTDRPTPEQLLADATSREEAVRFLINFGYLL